MSGNAAAGTGGQAASIGGSVFLNALGAEAERLHPEVLKYVRGPETPGSAVIVEGVFDVAGSKLRKLNLLALPIVGRNVFVTAHESDVPFYIVNSLVQGPGGSLELHADREFTFTGGPQRFVDLLTPGERAGTLCNRVGSAGRVELELLCSVIAAGHLRLASARTWLRFGRVRLRLPALLSVRAEVVDGYDDVAQRNIVDARVRSPLLGTVLEYRGSFTHRPA